MTEKLTFKAWREENSSLFQGVDPAPCPGCGRTGFYAARDDHPDKPGQLYRSCTFCGWWQDIGKAPYRRVRHSCHGFEATTPPEREWSCPGCGARDAPGEGTPWPIDDPEHQWWHVPQGLSQKEYLTYWQLEWGYDARPFGIV